MCYHHFVRYLQLYTGNKRFYVVIYCTCDIFHIIIIIIIIVVNHFYAGCLQSYT